MHIWDLTRDEGHKMFKWCTQYKWYPADLARISPHVYTIMVACPTWYQCWASMAGVGPAVSPHCALPADTRRWINVVLTVVHRLRRCTNVKPTFVQLLVSVRLYVDWVYTQNVVCAEPSPASVWSYSQYCQSIVLGRQVSVYSVLDVKINIKS